MLNKITIIGNLGHEPKISNTNNGNTCATLSVAVTEKGYTLANGTQIQEHTEWFNVVIWGKLANVAGQYLHKGSKVYVEGKLRTREYTAKDGTKKKATEVICDNFIMLSSKQESNAGGTPPQQQQTNMQQQLQNVANPYGVPNIKVSPTVSQQDTEPDLPF